MAIVFVKVNPVTYDKDVLYFGPKIIRLHCHLSTSLLIQERAYLYRMRVCKERDVPLKIGGSGRYR